MALPRKLYEELQARHEAESREARAETRRDLIRTALVCWAWALLGLFLFGWAFHTTNESAGWISFYAAIIVGVGGQVYTLAAAYRRGVKRGDW